MTCMLSYSQSCLTLCNPMDCSPPGSSVRGILQARLLAWVAMPSSRGSSQPRDRTQVSSIAGGILTAELPGVPNWWQYWPSKLLYSFFFFFQSSLVHGQRVVSLWKSNWGKSFLTPLSSSTKHSWSAVTAQHIAPTMSWRGRWRRACDSERGPWNSILILLLL